MTGSGKVIALVVAAGSGARAGGGLPKQYRRIGNKALLAHAVDALSHPRIDEVRVTIGGGQESLYRDAMGERPLPAPILGGSTRRHSVRNGLEAIAQGGGAGIVLIHDAARPFLSASVIDRLLDALKACDGAVPVLPAVDTMAMLDGRAGLGGMIPREDLVKIQTPQAFRFEAIRRAHDLWSGPEATDDSQVALAAGLKVTTVEGDPMLEKLTFESDFEQAERRACARMVSRTGSGFDVHAFDEGRELWLCGVPIPHTHGLKGHSDADVALHALTDALLSAIGAGDIGDHFPPSDARWRDARSSLFLEHARDLVNARGGIIDHADVTIICEAPKIAPYKQQMREKVAGLLRLPPGRISIKATTTEGLGFTGRGEGMAAQAIATVRMPEDQ